MASGSPREAARPARQREGTARKQAGSQAARHAGKGVHCDGRSDGRARTFNKNEKENKNKNKNKNKNNYKNPNQIQQTQLAHPRPTLS